MVGTGQWLITDLERGIRQPSPELAAAIAGVLGVSTQVLFPDLNLEDPGAAPEKEGNDAGRS